MAEKITHFFKRKKDVEWGKSSAKEGEKDEPSSNRKKLKPYHMAMLKTVQKWESNCELDTANCEFKLKPLAKVCKLVKRLVSSPAPDNAEQKYLPCMTVIIEVQFDYLWST